MLPVGRETRQRYIRFLRQAGHYHSQAVTEFLSLRNALVVGTVLWITATIVVVTEPGDAASIWLAVAGLIAIVIVYSLPRLVLETMAKRRTRRIEESLPDAMDMITMCVSAGLPLQQAILRVSGEMQLSHPDLSFELRIVGRQTQASSLNSAFQQFAKRMDVPEVHSMASMVWQAEQLGAGVAGAFQSFSDQVRLQRGQRALEAGNKTAFKMLFPLVFCLAPAVYIMLLGPAVLDLREFFRRERQPGGALSRETIRSLTPHRLRRTRRLHHLVLHHRSICPRRRAAVRWLRHPPVPDPRQRRLCLPDRNVRAQCGTTLRIVKCDPECRTTLHTFSPAWRRRLQRWRRGYDRRKLRAGLIGL